MYGYNNPYLQSVGNFQSPYNARLNALQGDFVQRQEIIRVNGENGARAYSLAPNSSILLLDETAPIIWLAQTDGAGYKTVTPYTITPYQAEAAPDYATLEARIKKMEDMLNEKPNNAGVKSKTAE